MGQAERVNRGLRQALEQGLIQEDEHFGLLIHRLAGGDGRRALRLLATLEPIYLANKRPHEQGHADGDVRAPLRHEADTWHESADAPPSGEDECYDQLPIPERGHTAHAD